MRGQRMAVVGEDEGAGYPDLQRHKEAARSNVRHTSSHLHCVSPASRPLHLQAGKLVGEEGGAKLYVTTRPASRENHAANSPKLI